MKMEAQVMLNVPKFKTFRAGSIRGRYVAKEELLHPGRLSEFSQEVLIDHAGLIDYAVFSYDTPIAWHVFGVGWHIVDERFSQTTSRHQNMVKRSLDFAARRDHQKQAV